MIFPDFYSLFKIPWLENAFPFFQVFQSEWEPWQCVQAINVADAKISHLRAISWKFHI